MLQCEIIRIYRFPFTSIENLEIAIDAPSTISANEQILASCIAIFSDQIPQSSDALDGKFFDIMDLSDINYSIISFMIINPIRHRSSNRMGGKTSISQRSH